MENPSNPDCVNISVLPCHGRKGTNQRDLQIFRGCAALKNIRVQNRSLLFQSAGLLQQIYDKMSITLVVVCSSPVKKVFQASVQDVCYEPGGIEKS
jgi:hypothetical protein